MSLSWRRQASIAVDPEGAAVIVTEGMYRNRIIHRGAWTGSAAEPSRESWEPALEVLRRELCPRYHGARRTRITISNHFCRYALLPDPAVLTHESEVLAYARHKMRALFGDTGEAWELRPCRFPNALLVCAAPVGLLRAARALCAEYRMPVSSIQPYFAAAFNRFRQQIGRESGWFLVQEKGRLVLGRLVEGRWQHLASRRTTGDDPESLFQVLARECRLAGAPGNGRVWLSSATQHYQPADLSRDGYVIRVLEAGRELGLDDCHGYALAA